VLIKTKQNLSRWNCLF